MEYKVGCEYCEGAVPLVIGKTNDYGIAIRHECGITTKTDKIKIMAYGFDVHGTDCNGISTEINYCPMCGRNLKNAYQN